MRTFKQTSSGIVVGLSLKVMFTFFLKHPDFAEIYPPNVTPDFFLSRNPFDRAYDLYADKCQSRVALDGPEQWCQMILVELLGLRQRSDLENVTFKEFCEALTQAIGREEHFDPQFPPCGLKALNLDKPNTTMRVVQIETGLPRLGEKLGIDFSQKVNAPEYGHWTQYYDAESLYIVKELYRQDFVIFGY